MVILAKAFEEYVGFVTLRESGLKRMSVGDLIFILVSNKDENLSPRTIL
jgi:hypothetical protein